MTSAKTKDLGRRLEIEAELADKYHVEFTYLRDVPTDEFDIDKSLHNQARFEAINDATVETYKEAVLRGDKFPAVIAYRPGRAANAKLVIIDGNHRLVAHDRAKTPLDVYEIDRSTKGQTVALMTYAFNTKHGKATSIEERVTAALYLIDNGASQERAASEVNVQLGEVKRALAKARADARADDVGVDRREWEALTAAARGRLLNISTDEGFRDAVHLAYAARLGAEECFELTTLLNTSRSSTKQRGIVKSETTRHAERISANAGGVLTNPGRGPMTPKGRLNLMLGQVLALPDDPMTIARSYAEGEREEASSRLLDVSERLRKIALSLNPRLK